MKMKRMVVNRSAYMSWKVGEGDFRQHIVLMINGIKLQRDIQIEFDSHFMLTSRADSGEKIFKSLEQVIGKSIILRSRLETNANGIRIISNER